MNVVGRGLSDVTTAVVDEVLVEDVEVVGSSVSVSVSVSVLIVDLVNVVDGG